MKWMCQEVDVANCKIFNDFPMFNFLALYLCNETTPILLEMFLFYLELYASYGPNCLFGYDTLCILQVRLGSRSCVCMDVSGSAWVWQTQTI